MFKSLPYNFFKGELHDLSKQHWSGASDETRKKMARMSASAAWGRSDFEAMKNYATLLPRESQDGAFYRAVICVQLKQYEEAQEFIDLTRSLLDTEVTALSLESYQRAYPTMIAVQMLSELEEVMEYRLDEMRQKTIREMWWKRLQSCQRSMEDWQRIMQVRSLVISPQSDQRTWLKYASLCRKSGRLQLSHRTLVSILGKDPSDNLESALPTVHPQATFAYCKHLWASDQKTIAFNQLHHLVKHFVKPSLAQCDNDLAALMAAGKADDALRVGERKKEMRHLLARSYHKLGKWQESLQGINENTISHIRDYYQYATEHDSTWYKAWHSWAVHNFEAVLFYKHQQTPKKGGPGVEAASQERETRPRVNYISLYAVPALRGFVRSITLSSKDSSLQDTLRLLTLLFDYGHQADVYEALHDGLRTVAIDNWLQVIPQLIARIDNPRPLISRLVHQVCIISFRLINIFVLFNVCD